MSWENILKKPVRLKITEGKVMKPERRLWTDEEIKKVKKVGNELGLKVEGPKPEDKFRPIRIEFSSDKFRGWIQKSMDNRTGKYFVYTGWEKNIEGINSTMNERLATGFIDGARNERETFRSLKEAIDFIKENVKLRLQLLDSGVKNYLMEELGWTDEAINFQFKGKI